MSSQVEQAAAEFEWRAELNASEAVAYAKEHAHELATRAEARRGAYEDALTFLRSLPPDPAVGELTAVEAKALLANCEHAISWSAIDAAVGEEDSLAIFARAKCKLRALTTFNQSNREEQD